ncbi:hypothetical protein [Nocardioides convexus]|uniref:hypothetical protein n=1 Tax=Nocardioides convexus TaxID=2712224 RepID=UPI00241822D7|nr:hypothetical protein [Nocardioides convexus]
MRVVADTGVCQGHQALPGRGAERLRLRRVRRRGRRPRRAPRRGVARRRHHRCEVLPRLRPVRRGGPR